MVAWTCVWEGREAEKCPSERSRHRADVEPVPCPADPAPILYLRSGPLPEALPPSPPPRGASPPQGRVYIISGNQNTPGYQVSLIYGHLAVTTAQFTHLQNKDSHFQGCLGKSERKDTTSHHSLSRRHHIPRNLLNEPLLSLCLSLHTHYRVCRWPPSLPFHGG